MKGLTNYVGRSDLIRLHWEDRDDGKFPGLSVAKLTQGEKSRYVMVLGQNENPRHIELDYDDRIFFGVIKGTDYEFELTAVGARGKIM